MTTLNPYEPPQTDCGQAKPAVEPNTASLDPPIRVSGRLNRAETELALTLRERRFSKPSPFSWWLGLVLVLGWMWFSIAFVVHHPRYPAGYIALALMVAVVYFIYFFVPRSHRRVIDALEKQVLEVEYVFTTEAIGYRSMQFKGSIAWSDLLGFRDTDTMLMVLGESIQLPIASRWFAAEKEFKRLVYFVGHKLEMLP